MLRLALLRRVRGGGEAGKHLQTVRRGEPDLGVRQLSAAYPRLRGGARRHQDHGVGCGVGHQRELRGTRELGDAWGGVLLL